MGAPVCRMMQWLMALCSSTSIWCSTTLVSSTSHCADGGRDAPLGSRTGRSSAAGRGVRADTRGGGESGQEGAPRR